MSEQRRKQQQKRVQRWERSTISENADLGRDCGVSNRAYGAWWYYTNHRYDGFAKCWRRSKPRCTDFIGVRIAKNKKDVRGAFQYVPYVECAIKGSRDLAPACTAAKLKLFRVAVWRESSERRSVSYARAFR